MTKAKMRVENLNHSAFGSSVGLGLRTEDDGNLIVMEFTPTGDGPSKCVLTAPIPWVRETAKRLHEYADQAEAELRATNQCSE